MSARPFSIVVAADAANGIGRNGGLPWRLKLDMLHFKRLTSEVREPDARNAVIMGRRTWESIPLKFRPLPERINVVLTRGAATYPSGVLTAASLDDALAATSAPPDIAGIFVIGGEQVFREAVVHPACALVHLTRIEAEFDCDTFFPLLEPPWKRVMVVDPVEENGIWFQFETWGK